MIYSKVRFMVIIFVCFAFSEVRTAIQPLGRFNQELAKYIVTEIERVYPFCQVEILPVKAIPQSAYYPSRNRWRAEKLLVSLTAEMPRGYRKVIGVLEDDISTTKGEHLDWGLFGLADIGGKSCVMSVFRLKKSGTSEKLYHERVAKVAIHELGHTLGLAHCENPLCIMTDAKGLIKTFDHAHCLPCKECRQFIGLMNY